MRFGRQERQLSDHFFSWCSRGGELLAHDALLSGRFNGNDGGYGDQAGLGDVAFHRGLANEAMACYPSIEEIIRRDQEGELPSQGIVLTGHGTGGALAQFIALLLGQNQWRGRIKVFGFSVPSVWGKEAREHYHKIIDPYNSLHLYVNFDVVTYPHGDFYPVGTQVDLSPFNRPGVLRSFWNFIYRMGKLINKTFRPIAVLVVLVVQHRGDWG